jgi:periplasmic divalent cation tolerance protein
MTDLAEQRERRAMAQSILYVTCPSEDEAIRIGETLVEEKLVACANILGRTTSIFRWEGKVQRENEVALILKTRSELVDNVTVRVKALHSYKVPCVAAMSVSGGNPDFLNWIEIETAKIPALSRF